MILLIVEITPRASYISVLGNSWLEKLPRFVSIKILENFEANADESYLSRRLYTVEENFHS